jgi:conjugative transposon TraM protein
MQPQDNKQSKKKRLLAALIIFGLPALLILGVVLSLYHPHSATEASMGKKDAFNPRMPAPNLKEREKNKLEVYLDAEKDSIRRQQLLHNDPYAKNASSTISLIDSARKKAGVAGQPAWPAAVSAVDSTERKVNEHLARLYKVLHNAGPAGEEGIASSGQSVLSSPNSTVSPLDRSVDRLQQLQNRLQQQDTAPNPQFQQINTLLDKVLAIQHPDRNRPASDSSGSNINKRNAYPVTAQDPKMAYQDGANPPAGDITVYDANSFYGLSDDSDSMVAASQVIRAVVHADQTVQTGSVVKLRLLQDIFIKGIRIPANSFIFGPCAISNERVAIHLSQVQFDGQVYPIDMRVLDGVDALEGLYVPGAISRDILKEGAGQSVSSLGLTSFDPSLGAQAAAAGIETARNLIGRKIRLITATLKAGTLAILQPAQSHP